MTTAPDVHWESWRRLRDPAAFEALVRPEMGRALSFARSLGCSDADAEDVLQESLVRLAAERSEGPSRIGVRAWLYRTVRDRARSRRRSWWRRRNREARAARPEATPPRTGDLEAREQVAQALDALPEAEREAVRLRYLQDLDYRDMAHVLGVSENACRTRVHRALETLKKRFGAGVATMVAALPLPVPTHSEHLLREVLRGAVPSAAAKGTIAAGWKIAGAAAVLAGAAVLASGVLPGGGATLSRSPPRPLESNPAPGPGKTAPASAVAGAEHPFAPAEAGPPPAGTPGPSVTPVPPAPAAPTAADAVSLLEEVASIGWDFGLRTSAAEVYGTILRIEPGHKAASARVGTDEGDAPLGEKERAAFDERLARASAKAAEILSGLGSAMDAGGNGKRAKDWWELALLVHHQDPVANEKLRSRRTSGGWATRVYETHLGFELDRMRRATSPRSTRTRDTGRTTGLPAAARIAVLRMESDHYLVEADHPARQVAEALEALEAVHGNLQDLLGTSGRTAVKARDLREILLLSARDYYERMVAAAGREGAPGKPAPGTLSSWRCAPGRILVLAPDVHEALPALLHDEAHELVKGMLGPLDPWLEEALASLASCPVLESPLAICRQGTESGALPPDRVPALLRSLVLRGKDPPLEGFSERSADQLTVPEIAKGWSVLLFLLETDAEGAQALLQEAGEAMEKDRARGKSGVKKSGPGKSGAGKERGGAPMNQEFERAISRHFRSFGTLKDLDSAWRAWALDVYRK